MLFRRNCGCLLGVIGICLLVSSTSSRGGIESRPDVVKRWRERGRLVLYQAGADRSPSAARLDQELDAVDLRSGEALRKPTGKDPTETTELTKSAKHRITHRFEMVISKADSERVRLLKEAARVFTEFLGEFN